MNLWLITAGVAALLLDVVHITLGGREFHTPMLRSGAADPAKALWSVVWHATTAVMALGGLSLVAAGLIPDHALALAVLPIALFLATAALFIFYGQRRLGTLTLLPQWTAFLAISALGLIGLAA